MKQLQLMLLSSIMLMAAYTKSLNVFADERSGMGEQREKLLLLDFGSVVVAETTPANLGAMTFSKKDKRLYYSENHYQDWIGAIKNSTRPICDVETRHRTATICNAVNIAYELQQPLKWNPVKEVFDNVNANMMKTRPYRRQ